MTRTCTICGRELFSKAPNPNPEHPICEPNPPGPTITISTPSVQRYESASPIRGGSYEPMEAILLQVLKILESSSVSYDLNLSRDSEQLSFSFKGDIPAAATG